MRLQTSRRASDQSCSCRTLQPSNNQVHLTRSAGETERPLQVTWVFGRLSEVPGTHE
jgi:hypothetical protein